MNREELEQKIRLAYWNLPMVTLFVNSMVEIIEQEKKAEVMDFIYFMDDNGESPEEIYNNFKEAIK